MKYLPYFSVLSVALIIIGCSVLKTNNSLYNGTWLLQSKSGGFTGRTLAPDVETKLVIKNNKMRMYENGKLVSENAFELEKRKVIQSSEIEDVIVNNHFKKQSVTISNDTLIITDQCYDCFTYYYIKE